MINMFENATFKLTLIYMGILSLICFFFSYNWYSIAAAELDQGLDRQRVSLTTRPRFLDDKEVIDEILDEASVRYEEAEDAVLRRIVLTNIIIISSGTLGAYFLARRTLDPIEEAHQEQMRFTADASHELRTPIAAMRSEIEVALRDPSLNKNEAVKLLKSSIEELGKLSELSEGLLKLARQDESVGIELETVSLDAIVNKAIDRVHKASKQKKISILSEVTDAKVRADFDSMTELVVILLDNAIKYSPKDSKVLIKTRATRNYVTLSIKDDGIGIRQSDQQHIFERFYRADNSRSSQNTKGHGLGLSIAKSISDIHDAGLSVESQGSNTGTEFSFRLRKSSI